MFFTVLSILQKVIKPDSGASGSATAAEEIIHHLEEENKMLRIKLHLVRMEKVILSRYPQLNDVRSRMEEQIETGERWNNTFNHRRDWKTSFSLTHDATKNLYRTCWQADTDTVVPCSNVPGATVHYIPGAFHFPTYFSQGAVVHVFCSLSCLCLCRRIERHVWWGASLPTRTCSNKQINQRL